MPWLDRDIGRNLGRLDGHGDPFTMILYKNVDAILELEAIVGNRPCGIELWRVSNSTIAISPNRSWFFTTRLHVLRDEEVSPISGE
jgi:hypothetical protein